MMRAFDRTIRYHGDRQVSLRVKWLLFEILRGVAVPIVSICVISESLQKDGASGVA